MTPSQRSTCFRLLCEAFRFMPGSVRIRYIENMSKGPNKPNQTEPDKIFAELLSTYDNTAMLAMYDEFTDRGWHISQRKDKHVP